MANAAEQQSLRRELDYLKRSQEEALAVAVYVGMTAEQAQTFDKRRKRIQAIRKTLRGRSTL